MGAVDRTPPPPDSEEAPVDRLRFVVLQLREQPERLEEVEP